MSAASLRWYYSAALADWYRSDDGGLSWYSRADRSAPDGELPPYANPNGPVHDS